MARRAGRTTTSGAGLSPLAFLAALALAGSLPDPAAATSPDVKAHAKSEPSAFEAPRTEAAAPPAKTIRTRAGKAKPRPAPAAPAVEATAEEEAAEVATAEGAAAPTPAADGTEVVAPLPPTRPFLKSRFVDLGLKAPGAAPRGRRGREAAPATASLAAPEDPAAARTPAFVRSGGAIAGLIDAHAEAHGVPASIAHAVVKVESRYNPRAAHAGNYGLMQIRLATARSMGYVGTAEGLLDAETNVKFGMRYLAEAHRLSGGSLCGTAAKYQGGLRASGGSAASRAYCAKIKANGGGV